MTDTDAEVRAATDSDELIRLRERLRMVGSAARIGIWEYDFETGSLWVSDELAALYGVDPDELTWPDFVSRIHPDDVVGPLLAPTPSFPFGEVNEFTLRVRHRNGHYLRIRSRSTTHGRRGRPARKLGAHIDMSEDSLVGLNDQLAEANERLRQFNRMASHDLRSPLRTMSRILNLVLEEEKDLSAEELRAWLEKGATQLVRMDRLVSDMLDFATADLDDVRPVLVDVERLLRDTVAVVDPGACTISIDAQVADPVEIVASPLAQCVRNLVDNACKYNDNANGLVEVTIIANEPWIEVSVSDDGPGIPEKDTARIFEPFYSSRPNTSTGLGLAHVRRTAERFDAVLELDSKVGVGTSFVLKWPTSHRSAP